MNFYDWLKTQTARKDDVGSLARYVVKDRFFPKTAKHLFIFLLRFENHPEQHRWTKRAHKEWRRVKKQEEAVA